MNAEIDSGGPETVPNPEYASDETTTLLVRLPAGSEVDISSASQLPNQRAPQERETSYKSGSKPMLIRQDCTTSRLSVSSPRPLLPSPGGIGCVGSEESAASVGMEENGVRSVPDIELHCRKNENNAFGIPREGGSGRLFHANGVSSPRLRIRGSSVTGYGHLSPHYKSRCDCRRESHSRLSSFPRSVSRESVRSIGNQHVYQCTPYSAPPAVLLTTTSSSSRVIRQSSQPESSLGKYS